MTLYQIIQILKEIALTQPNIKSATDGSIYDIMNTNPSVKYNVVHFSQTTHQSDEETDYYGLNVFYVSRLEDSLEDNRLQIQSIGKEVLDNIIRTFCENWGIDFPIITYTPFTQKFNDLCAGCYCNLRLEIPKEIICADDYIGEVVPSEKDIRLQNISVTITENGTRVFTPSEGFDGIGQITVITDVPPAEAHLQYKEVEYTQNGDYTVQPDENYDGISELAITVNVPATEDRYEEGFADGYNSGYTDGEEAQRAKLTALTVTENGEYTRADGWSSVTVNVPVTAYTDQDLIANLQGDYYVIPDGTTHLRPYAFYGTCFSSITIPTSVSAIGYFAFSKNTCLKEITIPDSVLSVGFGAFQDCTNLTSVTLSNSLTKLDNGLFAGCTSLPSITIPANISSVGARVFEGCRSLTAMTFLGLNPPSLYDIGTGFNPSLGSTAYTFPIYVPCESYDAYVEAFGPYYSPRIQCIPTPTSILDFIYTGNAGDTKILWTATTMAPQDHPQWVLEQSEVDKWFSNIIKMEIDGVEVTPTSAYTFSTSGRHNVKYYLKTGVIPRFIFCGEYIGDDLVEANIGTGITTIRWAAFQNCHNLTAVTFPDSLVEIDRYPFDNTGILSIVIPDSVTTLGEYFTYTSGGKWEFGPCSNCSSLSSVTLGTGLTYLPTESFLSCTSLTSVTIPAGVTTIYDDCFKYCSGLTSMTFLGENPPVLGNATAIAAASRTFPIYVPSTAVNAYKTAWPDYAGRIFAIS